MNENPTSLLDDESILGSPSSEETTDGSSLIDETESEEESEESDAHARIHLRVPIHADPLINLESIHPITFADYQIPKHQAVLPDDPDETLEDFIDDAEQQPIPRLGQVLPTFFDPHFVRMYHGAFSIPDRQTIHHQKKEEKRREKVFHQFLVDIDDPEDNFSNIKPEQRHSHYIRRLHLLVSAGDALLNNFPNEPDENWMKKVIHISKQISQLNSSFIQSESVQSSISRDEPRSEWQELMEQIQQREIPLPEPSLAASMDRNSFESDTPILAQKRGKISESGTREKGPKKTGKNHGTHQPTKGKRVSLMKDDDSDEALAPLSSPLAQLTSSPHRSQRQLSSNNLTDSITSEHDKATEMHQVTKRSGLKRKGSNSSGGRREADFESRKREEQNSDALETFDSSVSTSFALESFTSPQSPANLPSVPHNQSSSVGSNVMPVGVIPPQPTKPKPGVRIKHPNILPTIPASTFMLPAHAVPSTAPPWNQQSAISPQPQRQPVQPDSYSTRQKDQTVQFSVRQDPNLPRSSPTSPKPLTSHLNQVSEPPQTSHHSTGSVLFTSQAPIFPSSEQDLNETT